MDDLETGEQGQGAALDVATGVIEKGAEEMIGGDPDGFPAGREFLIIRKGRRSKEIEHYIIDARSGVRLLHCRNASDAARFDVAINTPDGENAFNVREGGERDSAEMFSMNDERMARIARTSSIFKNFETFDAKGKRVLKIESRGQSWEIKKENKLTGEITRLDRKGAREILGSGFDDLDRKEYDYRNLHV